jgi:hypothetical protein
VGWPIVEDLVFNGEDDDCDGAVDEDVYKGLKVSVFTYGSGAEVMTGGAWTLAGVLDAPAFHGTSSGGELVCRPGMPLNP